MTLQRQVTYTKRMSKKAQVKKSPRKFSEKIALIKEKEALTNACFESAIQSLSEITMGQDLLHQNHGNIMKTHVYNSEKFNYSDMHSISDSPTSFISNSSSYSHESPTSMVHSTNPNHYKETKDNLDSNPNQQNISYRQVQTKNNIGHLYRHSNQEDYHPESLLKLLTDKDSHGGSMPNVAMIDNIMMRPQYENRISDDSHKIPKDISSITEALSDLEDMKTGIVNSRKAIAEHLKNRMHQNNINNNNSNNIGHFSHPHHVSHGVEDKHYPPTEIILNSPPSRRRNGGTSHHHDDCASSNINEKGIMKHYSTTTSPYIAVQHHNDKSHTNKSTNNHHNLCCNSNNKKTTINISQRSLTPQLPSINTQPQNQPNYDYNTNKYYQNSTLNTDTGFIVPISSMSNNVNFLSPQFNNGDFNDICRRAASDSSLVQTLKNEDNESFNFTNRYFTNGNMVSDSNTTMFPSFSIGTGNLHEQCSSASYLYNNRDNIGNIIYNFEKSNPNYTGFQRLNSDTSNIPHNPQFQCQITHLSDPAAYSTNSIDKIPDENIDPNLSLFTSSTSQQNQFVIPTTSISHNSSSNSTQNSISTVNEINNNIINTCNNRVNDKRKQKQDSFIYNSSNNHMSIDQTNIYSDYQNEAAIFNSDYTDDNSNSSYQVNSYIPVKKEKVLVSQTSDPSDKCYWASSKMTANNHNHVTTDDTSDDIHACRNLDMKKISVDLSADFSCIPDIDNYGSEIERRNSLNWTEEILNRFNNTFSTNSFNNNSNNNNSNNINNNNNNNNYHYDYSSNQSSQLNTVSEDF